MFKKIAAIFLVSFYLCDLNAQKHHTPPNIIVILADDLGWADLTSYGSTFYETPFLDQLAKEGIKFTNAYSTSPVCSPTRASLMTGKYPTKTGVTDWIPGRSEDGKKREYEKINTHPTSFQLALEEKTIAEYAIENGYQTFFAGKWHLGEVEKFWPQHQGFQTNIGGWSKGAPTGKLNDSTGGFFTPYKNPLLSDGPMGEYLTDRLTNECIRFLENKSDKPFFLMYSMYAVHNPLQAPKSLIKKYQLKKDQLRLNDQQRFAKDEDWMKPEVGWKRRLIQDNPVYAAMIENMDWNVGRLLNKIKSLNLDDNTIVVFTSDNGGLSTAEGSNTVNTPFRAGKGWLYEGGIRVPLIIYWKGKLLSGKVSSLPVTTADLYPTLASAINRKYKKDSMIDGDNIFPMIQQVNKKRMLFWHYPHYSNQGGKPSAAIRSGEYKLIYHYENQQVALFDLTKDIAEKNNIALKNKALTNQLKRQLLSWLNQIGAKTL
ncbi:sulfatase [Sediminibacterium sp.]|uniref:sulfatase n=1 Tax=Sediminibacterium sp. TaxID=1917865 RepID=UPI003F6E840B